MDQSQHNGIDTNQRQRTVASAIWGGAVVAVILLITTIWTSTAARSSTNQAVAQVSEFPVNFYQTHKQVHVSRRYYPVLKERLNEMRQQNEKEISWDPLDPLGSFGYCTRLFYTMGN